MGGTSRALRVNLWLHRWCSLLATIPFLVLCLTGTVLIFHEEIDHAMGTVPEARASAGGAQPLPYAASIANVRAAYPGERVLSAGVDPDHHPGVLLVLTAAHETPDFEHALVRYTDLATASLIGDDDPGTTLTGLLLELHAQWFLGPVGELIGALIALLVVISLVTGLVVYAPHVKRVAFGVLRRGRGPRLLQLDLHNFIGAIVLGWAFVVSATGFLLGFSTLAIGLWQMGELGDFHRQAALAEPVDARAPPVDVDRVIAAASATAEPGWQVTSIIFPGTQFSTPRHYTVLLTGTEGLEERLFRVTAIDAKTGDVTLTKELPPFLKAIELSQPLHFGDYGGLLLKILWTLFTWLTLFITANGAWLWWDRRRGLAK